MFPLLLEQLKATRLPQLPTAERFERMRKEEVGLELR